MHISTLYDSRRLPKFCLVSFAEWFWCNFVTRRLEFHVKDSLEQSKALLFGVAVNFILWYLEPTPTHTYNNSIINMKAVSNLSMIFWLLCLSVNHVKGHCSLCQLLSSPFCKDAILWQYDHIFLLCWRNVAWQLSFLLLLVPHVAILTMILTARCNIFF